MREDAGPADPAGAAEEAAGGAADFTSAPPAVAGSVSVWGGAAGVPMPVAPFDSGAGWRSSGGFSSTPGAAGVVEAGACRQPFPFSPSLLPALLGGWRKGQPPPWTSGGSVTVSAAGTTGVTTFSAADSSMAPKPACVRGGRSRSRFGGKEVGVLCSCFGAEGRN